MEILEEGGWVDAKLAKAGEFREQGDLLPPVLPGLAQGKDRVFVVRRVNLPFLLFHGDDQDFLTFRGQFLEDFLFGPAEQERRDFPFEFLDFRLFLIPK